MHGAQTSLWTPALLYVHVQNMLHCFLPPLPYVSGISVLTELYLQLSFCTDNSVAHFHRACLADTIKMLCVLFYSGF